MLLLLFKPEDQVSYQRNINLKMNITANGYVASTCILEPIAL